MPKYAFGKGHRQLCHELNPVAIRVLWSISQNRCINLSIGTICNPITWGTLHVVHLSQLGQITTGQNGESVPTP